VQLQGRDLEQKQEPGQAGGRVRPGAASGSPRIRIPGAKKRNGRPEQRLGERELPGACAAAGQGQEQKQEQAQAQAQAQVQEQEKVPGQEQ